MKRRRVTALNVRMAFRDTSKMAFSPNNNPAGPPSIISSQITDMASDDGGKRDGDIGGTLNNNRDSFKATANGLSVPDTSTTAAPTQRSPWMQSPSSPKSQGTGVQISLSRSGSVSMSASTVGRPQSPTARTHVPSLTSHAFFRPMSSQRLQAQRGGSKPRTPSHSGINDDGLAESSNVGRQSAQSAQIARPGPAMTEGGGDMLPPPSRGTEMTEPETPGRITANTSPTPGHEAKDSLTESVRPLQRNNPNAKSLSLNIDKIYKISGGIPTPSKSPHSFRSSFLLPAKGDPSPNSPNRSTQGREKLSSVASSPALTPFDTHRGTPQANLGSNYQYFAGNTRFCWGGRLQNTRDRPVNVATGLLVLVPGVLFLTCQAPWLWNNISPAIPLVFGYVFYICFSSFIHASASDPGVSPFRIFGTPRY